MNEISSQLPEEQTKTSRPFTRREFIGSVMLASAGAVMLSATKAAPRWQIGCYTRPWAKFEYRVAFDNIADAGYRYVGLMTSATGLVIKPETTPDEAYAVGQEAKKRGLAIASAYCSFDIRKSVPAAIDEMRKIIDNLHTCGCPGLLLGGIGNPALVDDYYKVVAESCDYAASKGVGISVKPHGGVNATGPECRTIVEKVGHKNFGIWYDPGNIYYYSDGVLDPVDDSKLVDKLVVGMSVKDFMPPKVVDITPGTGKVDFPKVMANLKKGGFKRGPLIVECLSPGDVSFVNAEARKTRLFLEEMMRRI